MNEYILSTCTTCDLSREHVDGRGIHTINFHYSKDHVMYDDDLYQSITPKEFYDSMAAGAVMTTSQVNTAEFTEYFKSFLDDGKDVIHVSLSTGISGVYNAAETAATQLRTQYPERRIAVIDSLAASSGLGLLLDRMADLRDGGADFDEIVDWTESNKLRLHHWFFTSDLTYFVRGGRVSRVSGALGGMLGICPLLNVSNEGRLVARAKVRPKKKVIDEMVRRMEEHAENGHDYAEKVFMCQSECYDDAKAVAEQIESKFPRLKDGRVLINHIGTVIGSHTGPGTVALFFWGDLRTD